MGGWGGRDGRALLGSERTRLRPGFERRHLATAAGDAGGLGLGTAGVSRNGGHSARQTIVLRDYGSPPPCLPRSHPAFELRS